VKPGNYAGGFRRGFVSVSADNVVLSCVSLPGGHRGACEAEAGRHAGSSVASWSYCDAEADLVERLRGKAERGGTPQSIRRPRSLPDQDVLNAPDGGAARAADG
jgi:hypothetical protein